MLVGVCCGLDYTGPQDIEVLMNQSRWYVYMPMPMQDRHYSINLVPFETGVLATDDSTHIVSGDTSWRKADS